MDIMAIYICVVVLLGVYELIKEIKEIKTEDEETEVWKEDNDMEVKK